MAGMVKFTEVTKRFPGNTALDRVSFDIRKGEVHALLGENGAGKSTLLNILHGIYGEYEGSVEADGQKLAFRSASDAIEFGISKVHQEVSVVTELTVGQNIALGYEPRKGAFIDFQTMYKKTDEILKRLGCRFDSRDRLDSLSTGELQMILIAKALFHNAKVISFDEPTSALTDKEVDKLLAVIGELKAQGITILYVTHRLDEVFRIADRASILRDGHYVCTLNIPEINKEMLIRNMVGRDVEAFAVRKRPRCVRKEVALKVENLQVAGVFQGVSFELHKGEILSFSGLVGAKRTDVMRAIFGADRKTGGRIVINGQELDARTPGAAMKHGVALIPENRKTQGFIQRFTNSQNMSLADMKNFTKHGFLDFKRMKENSEYYIEQMDLNPKDPDYRTDSLSGGNAQKVIIAKWMTINPEVIIFDEPTKGIDVGAKAEIYRLMEEMAAAGKAILMVSSELPEVIGMSDRVIVMREGRVTGELSRDDLSEETILHLAMEG